MDAINRSGCTVICTQEGKNPLFMAVLADPTFDQAQQ